MDSLRRSSIGEFEKPWKYIGYKFFSRWMASDPSFFIVRRFGALNARVALALQDEIVKLEERLDFLDKIHSDRDAPDVHNGSFREDPFTDADDRQVLMRDVLPEKLAKYNAFLNEYAQLVSGGPSDPKSVKDVRRWLMEIRPGAIDGRESAYIDRDYDLITVGPHTKSWLRDILQEVLFKAPVVGRFFASRPPDDIVQLDNEYTVWPDNQKMEILSLVMTSLTGLSMLIGPLWILAYVQRVEIRLAVISGFILIFFLVVRIATTTRLHEVLAATAAYSAVLVVFLQAGT